VLVTAGRELALVTGDLLVHAVQLLHPEIAYAFDIDPETARRSRELLLAHEPETTLYVATSHLTDPFTAH
jgi:glyoxylase-like metal-dependent hydrolase (beta-lactamase superfamily II)